MTFPSFPSLPFPLQISIDTEKNPNYLGPLPLSELSAQIASSTGPSGPNSQYLFMLCEAMREYGLHDDDLFELEKQVQSRLEKEL